MNETIFQEIKIPGENILLVIKGAALQDRKLCVFDLGKKLKWEKPIESLGFAFVSRNEIFKTRCICACIGTTDDPKFLEFDVETGKKFEGNSR
ncbi:MAG: hypothetical protein GY861_27490 [bacterium]|nr:hypothetical protein [bacterium]